MSGCSGARYTMWTTDDGGDELSSVIDRVYVVARIAVETRLHDPSILCSIDAPALCIGVGTGNRLLQRPKRRQDLLGLRNQRPLHFAPQPGTDPTVQLILSRARHQLPESQLGQPPPPLRDQRRPDLGPPRSLDAGALNGVVGTRDRAPEPHL